MIPKQIKDEAERMWPSDTTQPEVLQGIASLQRLAYHLGATRDAWVTDGSLPERQPNTSYSQVACLVVKNKVDRKGGKYLGDVQILVFNHEHQVWDGEDGDDFDCKIEDVYAWMLLPTLPSPPKTGI